MCSRPAPVRRDSTWCATRRGDIGAVLLDFNMPRFNGAETLQFLRKLSPNVKVLAVSGVSSNELPSDFREGVERFIPKPFSNADLLKTLEEILDSESGGECVRARLGVSRPPASARAVNSVNQDNPPRGALRLAICHLFG